MRFKLATKKRTIAVAYGIAKVRHTPLSSLKRDFKRGITLFCAHQGISFTSLTRIFKMKFITNSIMTVSIKLRIVPASIKIRPVLLTKLSFLKI